MDMDSGAVEETCLAYGVTVDFPTIAPQFVGQKTKYAYFACTLDDDGVPCFAECALSESSVLPMSCIKHCAMLASCAKHA
jgi:carotenoid cleavage dioxygenase-like enzyme